MPSPGTVLAWFPDLILTAALRRRSYHHPRFPEEETEYKEVQLQYKYKEVYLPGAAQLTGSEAKIHRQPRKAVPVPLRGPPALEVVNQCTAPQPRRL